ncbi:hypothetical protein H4Q26_013000 [Puccinia striiformis f. sp. tritici PST-130]|nr:hypothetical protein H4Q26_013000 [Puccinia striiformis f. sp. tritici PST-130]
MCCRGFEPLIESLLYSTTLGICPCKAPGFFERSGTHVMAAGSPSASPDCCDLGHIAILGCGSASRRRLCYEPALPATLKKKSRRTIPEQSLSRRRKIPDLPLTLPTLNTVQLSFLQPVLLTVGFRILS